MEPKAKWKPGRVLNPEATFKKESSIMLAKAHEREKLKTNDWIWKMIKSLVTLLRMAQSEATL